MQKFDFQLRRNHRKISYEAYESVLKAYESIDDGSLSYVISRNKNNNNNNNNNSFKG